MDSLRDQIAALIEPFLAEDDWADGEADKVADAILQILPSQDREPVAYLRDLDGTGSLHICAKDDPGAMAVYR